jgi:hypothetical protein
MAIQASERECGVMGRAEFVSVHGPAKDPLQHGRYLRERHNACSPAGLKDGCGTLLDARQGEQEAWGVFTVQIETSPCEGNT